MRERGIDYFVCDIKSRKKQQFEVGDKTNN